MKKKRKQQHTHVDAHVVTPNLKALHPDCADCSILVGGVPAAQNAVVAAAHIGRRFLEQTLHRLALRPSLLCR